MNMLQPGDLVVFRPDWSKDECSWSPPCLVIGTFTRDDPKLFIAVCNGKEVIIDTHNYDVKHLE